MAIVAMTGLEMKDSIGTIISLDGLDRWNSGDPSTSPVRTGKYSQGFSGTAGAYRYLYFPDASGDYSSGTTIADAWIKFHIWISSLPSSGNRTVCSAQSANIRLRSDGKFEVFSASNSVAVGTIVAPTGAWVQVNFRAQVGTSGAYSLYINGTLDVSGTADFGTSNVGSIQFGDASSGSDWSIYIDDAVVADSDPGLLIGSRVLPLFPTANGGLTAWVAGDTGMTGDYQDVDDYVSSFLSDYTTSYVKTSTQTAAETSLCSVQGIGASTGQVIAVLAAVMPWKVPTAALNAALRLRSGGTNSDASNIDLYQTNPKPLGKIYATDPATSAAWKMAAALIAEPGVIHNQSQSRQANCTAMGMFVLFVPMPVQRPVVLNQSIMRSALR